eukprot:gene2237-17843_t
MSTEPSVGINSGISQHNTEGEQVQENELPKREEPVARSSGEGENTTSVHVNTPVTTVGTSPEVEGGGEEDVLPNVAVIRRQRGRPKGAKNKNPKPKPPPKPKRPIGRPRKYTYALQTRFSKQQSFAKIEPVTDKPPDDIFEDET